MNYRFATENRNYVDYSSGRVFYNQKGTTAFPVRLASEIYQLCKSILINQGFHKPYVLYDPCCGGAYLLSSIGYLHGEEISKIYASDVEETIIPLAQKNLELLRKDRMDERIKEIQTMIDNFGKESHLEALKSALTLRDVIEKQDKTIEVNCFINDITKKDTINSTVNNINIVITDLPYGDIVNWNNVHNEDEAIEKLLDNIRQIISDYSVVSIVSKNKIKIRHKAFKQIERFVIGKRQITILQPTSRI